MLKETVGYFVLFLSILFTECDSLKKYDSQLTKSILPSLLGEGSKNRVVILVSKDRSNTGGQVSQRFGSRDDSDTSSDDSDATERANDDAAYTLLHLLRTKPDDEDDILLQETKDILREGLRTRCWRMEVCITECLPRKPKCPKKCRQSYDNLDMCRPKKKVCKKPKCGKTMPPKWRMLLK